MGTIGVPTMRVKLRLRVSRTTAAFCLGFVAAVIALGVLTLRTSASPETAEVTSQTQQQPPSAEPRPVEVPQSASAARASGSGGRGGSNWMSGNASQLGADFKRSVAHQFGNGTMGQAHLAMAGLGFHCAPGANGMSCEKSLQADNCTLTWSVNIKSRGANVSGAGGEGFARQCD
jgi:hypothetical protein